MRNHTTLVSSSSSTFSFSSWLLLIFPSRAGRQPKTGSRRRRKDKVEEQGALTPNKQASVI
ncbi:hypothetical protein INR49_010545 [Caranx melampygus]|nr:hypothetical protein INR49_010545 [Caranx melampygus]